MSLKTPQVIQRPIEDLKEVLRYAMMKVGLRAVNIPADIEKQVLIEHVVSNYGNHTHEEIKLAFDLAITGKLDVDPNCFENFSCVYFSKIMNAYRAWAGKTYKEVVKEKHPEVVKEDLSDRTMQDWWNDVSLKVRTKGLPYFSIGPMLYKWAEEKGMIKNSGFKKSEFVTKFFDLKIKDLLDKYSLDRSDKTKIELEDYQRMKRLGLIEAYYVGVVQAMCRSLMIHEMMLKEVENGNSDLAGI